MWYHDLIFLLPVYCSMSPAPPTALKMHSDWSSVSELIGPSWCERYLFFWGANGPASLSLNQIESVLNQTHRTLKVQFFLYHLLTFLQELNCLDFFFTLKLKSGSGPDFCSDIFLGAISNSGGSPCPNPGWGFYPWSSFRVRPWIWSGFFTCSWFWSWFWLTHLC